MAVINGKNPRQHGCDFVLWTQRIVRELAERKLGAKLSLASIGRLLARLGLRAQKQLQQAYQRALAVTVYWERETYLAILQQAKREKAVIYF